MTAMTPDIQTIEQADSSIHVVWADGHRSQYHHIWLRHQCECRECGTPMDGLRNAWILDIPEKPEIEELTSGPDGVRITWADNHHQSVYSPQWLRRHCYDPQSRAARRHRVTNWDTRIQDHIPAFEFPEARRSAEIHLKVLETVRDYGFCLLETLDTRLQGIRDAAHLFGPVRITHFGISEITEKSAQYNVGDSGRALLPHMDETYRISSVGITVLQMVTSSESGGHSTLVDGFNAVRRLRETSPDAFDLLSTVPVTFRRRHTGKTLDGKPRLLVSRTPLIKLDENNEVVGVRINERHIAPLDVEGHLVEPFYRAIRDLLQITYDPGLRIEIPLKSGQGLVFDNQRVLHGRTAFVRGKKPRHARTCTVNTEEFHSTLRLRQLEFDLPESDQVLYQGM